jgi:NADPH:quinone reductase-like Zn-dependent oxidoreductase
MQNTSRCAAMQLSSPGRHRVTPRICASARLAEEGRFRPVIDRRYTFEQIPEAHRYVDLGRKRGNVIITVHDDGTDAG